MNLRLLRRAAVAGSWYPGTARSLASEVDGYLAAVPAGPRGSVIGLVAPHAGLMYSGPVAAHAYALVSGLDIETVVLIGPSHYVAFRGVAIYDRGAFDTPLGPVPIAEACASAIALASRVIQPHPTAHVREHSLEMQLPFIKRVLPDASIVPLVMGEQSPNVIDELAGALITVLAGRRVLLVASSDLSHFLNRAAAGRLDGLVIEHVRRFDPDGLMGALGTFPNLACGGGPIVCVMRAARALGALHARVLKHGDSGDVSGDTDAVVGYLAAAFGEFPEQA